ncbi:MAG: amino acid permease [Planctomycetaceae bacterium]
MSSSDIWLSASILLATAIVGGILLLPKVSRSEWWQATVTPLASIIGSGFLVLGPILVREYGKLAAPMMLGLCVVAYLFGNAIRYNIRHYESGGENLPRYVHLMESVSSWMLAFAYIISVSYYINLLGSFAVSQTSFNSQTAGRIVATCVLIFIGLFGFLFGLKKLESLEETAVGLKLSIITGLLMGMIVFAFQLFSQNKLAANTVPTPSLHSLYLAFGLVICVQGFETSRYLGEEHDAETRVKTMKASQWISTIIYVLYVFLMSFCFNADNIETSETAIIDVTRVIAPILPYLLIAAAVAAQFSAGVADTAGCGGLVAELTKEKVSGKVGYAVAMTGGLFLTWTANVFAIISYASKAFAIYYALQSLVALLVAWQHPEMKHRFRYCVLYGVLALLGVLIAVFGISAE